MKKTFLYLLCVVFIFILAKSLLGNSLLISKDYSKVKKSRTCSKAILSKNIKFNDLELPYDEDKNTYLCSVDEKKVGKNIILNVSSETKSLKSSIINQNFNVLKIDYNTKYEIVLYTKENYYKVNLQFTNLPTIQINTDSNISDNYVKSESKIIENYTSNQFKTQIKIRGCTSKAFKKKSYRLNLYDNKYKNKKKCPLFNMESNDSWILDALYTDPSKIRNTFGSDIWSDINSYKRNERFDIDLKCKFVELFINNNYVGLYSLKNPIDRNLVGAQKSSLNNTGIIIKSFLRLKPSFSEKEIFNITQNCYSKFELKYPNAPKMWNIAWANILPKIKSFMLGNYQYKVIKNTFEMENIVDYCILIDVIGSADHEKNYYIVMNDINSTKTKIIPWDMDLCFGIIWDPNNFMISSKCDNSKINFINYYGKDSSDIKFNKVVVDRYFDLRKNILTDEYINNKIDEYQHLLVKGGAARRDSERWYDYNIENEIEYVRNWSLNRMKYLDSYMGGIKVE